MVSQWIRHIECNYFEITMPMITLQNKSINTSYSVTSPPRSTRLIISFRYVAVHLNENEVNLEIYSEEGSNMREVKTQ